ncbi:MAG: excinuclease ABC subunit UvrC [Thiotrichaceae bacterium]|nr:excinuclease ABC subunit UvrC [Thiotrichaceae bacterium]PCI15172.1 MAG: excinuclease ABC subunit C [Thiotrichales bacterium]
MDIDSINGANRAEFEVKEFLQGLPETPGVYRMFNARDEVIYVGKARNLKKRVSSYFSRADGSPKTRALVTHIHHIEVTTTHTETEALILENNLIKQHKPRYNVLLRDDKSYPYIFLSTTQEYPRLSLQRGARKQKGRYFGPYPNAGAVRETLNLLQKLFLIRQCEDSFFSNRSRPCLQYQIKRCSAPCTKRITEAAYADDVRLAAMFLDGKNHHVIDELVDKMAQAAEQLAYEKAAQFRNQIAALRTIQEKQYVSSDKGNIDVVSAVTQNGIGCVEVFYIRDGHNLGNKSFFPRHTHNATAEEILAAFLPQFYLGKAGATEIPSQVIINHPLDDVEVLKAVLSEAAGRQVAVTSRVRAERSRWLSMATANAEQNLARYINTKSNIMQRFIALQEVLQMDSPQQRMECFDISHTSGEHTVASCVVFNQEGPLKSDYRRFNIEGITGGDDYAAMSQALMRRYTRLKKGEGRLPDILFIDGGKGQVREAEKVLEELQVSGVSLIGIAKGRARKAGEETLYFSESGIEINLPADSPALHLIQQIRDEAHRFAITGHRARRAKAQKTSVLEGVAGVGAKRRRQLLQQFGGLQGVARAGVEDLASIKGISGELAQRIYDIFHAGK